MKDFIRRALSDGDSPSSNRMFGFIALICFELLIAVITAYLMYKGTLEANITIVFGFAASAAAVPVGASTISKFSKTEVQNEIIRQ